jgi:hypothetical protein
VRRVTDKFCKVDIDPEREKNPIILQGKQSK